VGVAEKRAQGVPAFWAAINDDKTIEMSHSADDGNAGLASRQEVIDWINENDPRLHLVALYTAQTAPSLPNDAYRLLSRWLSYGRSAGRDLARHLIADTEAMLAAASVPPRG